MNNPFDYTPSAECDAAFRRLLDALEDMRHHGAPENMKFLEALDEGKMLGVLIASDTAGAHHTLYAFSGQIGEGGFYQDGFVGPAFDYLSPGGHFVTKMDEISCLDDDISRYEKETLQRLQRDYECAEARCSASVEAFKEECRESKRIRDAARASGMTDEAELAAMIRRSQYEKAELHRLKRRCAAELAPYAEALETAKSHLEGMKKCRRDESRSLQQWLFDNFVLLNARGESRSLNEIFADTSLRIPPSGAGECYAPKLLQAAYRRGLQPQSIAEYWYGRPKDGEVRIHGQHYPACRGKCLPVLGWMLQGLEITPSLGHDGVEVLTFHPEILFENRWFCIVDKPSGMLSVPGKSAAVSVQEWLAGRYGREMDVKVAHRLDRDTSGLLVAAFGSESYKIMQSLFARRLVKKTYVADLEGDYVAEGIPRSGRVSLPLIADILDRPRQRVDRERGKEAVTEYEFTEVREGRSRVELHPLTGRTHQLRVHAASAMGLRMPIIGDPLYGSGTCDGGAKMHLHARSLEFRFPLDGENYRFESPVPFTL